MPGDSEKDDENNLACSKCCGGQFVKDYQRNELICKNCGYVVRGELPDLTPEWRSYTDQEGDPSRVGPPTSVMVPNKGLPTRIPRSNRDARGNQVSWRKVRSFHRLRKWDRWSRYSGSGRYLSQASSMIGRAGGQLGITKPVRERAMMIYRETMGRGLVKGRRMEDLIGASIYSACREYGVQRSMSEIARVVDSSEDSLKKSLALLQEELGAGLPPFDPVHYVHHYLTTLGATPEFKDRALKLARLVRENGFADGKTPKGVAAAIMRVVSLGFGGEFGVEEIARISDLSEGTVAELSKKLQRVLKDELSHINDF